MENKVLINLDLLKTILNQESKKLTGKTMKRFEIAKDIDEAKKQVKEVQYEWCRDLYDTIENICKGENAIFVKFDNKKSKEE